jgi:hypothetical protein
MVYYRYTSRNNTLKNGIPIQKTKINRFYKILVIEPTTEVKAESIGAPSVKEIVNIPVDQNLIPHNQHRIGSNTSYYKINIGVDQYQIPHNQHRNGSTPHIT